MTQKVKTPLSAGNQADNVEAFFYAVREPSSTAPDENGSGSISIFNDSNFHPSFRAGGMVEQKSWTSKSRHGRPWIKVWLSFFCVILTPEAPASERASSKKKGKKKSPLPE